MMSTSGTTGSPKFVKQSYLNVKNNSEQIIKYLKIKKGYYNYVVTNFICVRFISNKYSFIMWRNHCIDKFKYG